MVIFLVKLLDNEILPFILTKYSVSNFSGVEIHKTSSESRKHGGIRMVTFMLYMSSVEAGGYTIFPQVAVTVKPEMGDALYWFNYGAQDNYDSRIYHLGCPVLHGNKWIANKWLKFLPNFKSYPCLVDKEHWSIYNY